MQILKKLTAEENIPKKYYHAVFDAEVAGIPCIVSKTGYTGEDGVELYLASGKAEEMWDALLEAGKEEGLDSLRTGRKRHAPYGGSNAIIWT